MEEFPGLREASFEGLQQLITEMEYDRLSVFTYSLEEDTPAARLPDHLSDGGNICYGYNIRIGKLVKVRMAHSFEFDLSGVVI